MKNYKLLLPGVTFALGPLLAYVALPFITSEINAVDYGVYTYYLSVLSIISFLAFLPALNSTVNRFGNKNSESYIDDMYTVKVIYYISLVIYFVCVSIAYYYHESTKGFEFVIIAVSILSVNIFNVIKSYLLINNDKTSYSFFVITVVFFQYSYLFYALSKGEFNVKDILFGNLVFFAFLVIFRFKVWINIVKLSPIKKQRNSKIFKFVGFSLAISLSTIIYNNTDKIMIDYILNDSRSLALYQVSFQIFSFPIESLYALISIFTPAFLYRAFDKNKDLYVKNLRITFKVVLFITFILSQVLLVNQGYLKKILLDPSYIVDDSLPFLFLINQSIFLLYLISTNIFIVYDKRAYIIGSLTFTSGINFLLNWYFISSFGYVGAAISTLISYSILMVLVTFFAYRIFGVKFLDKNDGVFILSVPVAFYLFSDVYLLWVASLIIISAIYLKTNIKNTYLSFLRGV